MIDFSELTQAIGNLDEDKVNEMLTEFVNSKPTKKDTLEIVNACQVGMGIVGDLFEKGKYFVGDLIFAGELLNEAINTLKPVIGGKSKSNIGTIVLGTVHGDLHDIGKNIFRSMAEAAGFVVYDLGTDQPVSAFVDKIKKVKPDIVGLSGVLTLAIESMKNTVEGLKDAGLRDSIKIIIGGNPVTQEVSDYVGADAFTTNAAAGVKICQEWVSK